MPTVSPSYMQKGVPNPYYTMDEPTVTSTAAALKREGYKVKNSKELLFKCVDKIKDIWSVSYTKGEYHSPHNHGSIGWAGILYLDLPKDSPVTSYLQPWNDIQNDTSIYHPVKVVEGQIVIVPQFVTHFSPPNKSTKKKRIISWDMELIPA